MTTLAPPMSQPLWLTPVPAEDIARGDGAEVGEFIEQFCTITQDTFAGPAGAPMVLRPWQRRRLGEIFARRPDGRRRHRIALLGEPRKNGKSGLAAGIALEGLTAVRGGEVYSCAADKDQARIVFGHARKMVEANAELSSRCKVYRDAIDVPSLGSVYRAVSSEAYTKEGLSPTLVVFDELHAQPTDELWEVMDQAFGARIDPLMLAITTAGVKTDITGQDSICYRIFQYGQMICRGEADDPTFYMAWYGAPDGAPYRDRDVWRAANPAFGDILNPEDMESKVLRTLENEFRTKRLNQWVSTQQAWLPAGSWEAIADARGVPEGVEVVLAFDGSFSGDSTGLTVHDCLDCHIDVVALWEKPQGAVDWQVNLDEVEETVRDAFVRWHVRKLVYDPRIYQQMFQRLEAEGYAVEAQPQGQQMIAASQRFYEDVKTGKLTHSGDPRLTRHIGNAVVKSSPQGPRVQKETPGSPRKIDLAICAVMGHAHAAGDPEPQGFAAAWR